MKKFIALLSLLPLLAFSPAHAQDAQSTAKHVQIQVIPEFSSVKPGQTIAIAIEEKIDDSWHVYWKNPGDSGEAIRINWTLPQGVTASDIQWPIPERIAFGPLLNFGYHSQVTFLSDLTVPAEYTGTEIPVTADIELLVCNDICIPETSKIDLKIPVNTNPATATDSALFKEARSHIPETVAWQGMVEEANKNLMLSFRADPEILPLFSAAKKVEFFPEEWGLIQNPATQDAKVENGQITLKIPRDSRALSEVKEIKGLLVYESTDGTRKGFNVSTPIASMPTQNTIAPAAIVDTKPPAPTLPLPDNGSTLIQALFFAFLGGLVLNLMPCVFPVLSIKALSLIKLGDKEKSKAAFYGLSYTAGVLVCFGAIAGSLIFLQQAGEHIGWGFQLQNPILVLLLSYLLFLIGLNLSGFFEISGRIGNLGAGLTQKQGNVGTFFTGMLATIVATPCTAPFMGLALGYALLQPPAISLLIFMMLGLGLAMPYLLLCLFPPLRKMLPRPGAWMETFRQFLAFPMFASAAWLVWVYGQQVESYFGVLQALIGIVLLAFALWAWKRAPERKTARLFIRSIAVIGAIISILIASFSMQKMMHLETAITTKAETMPGEQAFSTKAFDTALSGKDPIFVDMTAAWCITCKVNEQVALATDATRKLFKDKNVVYFKGDWTNQNPEITDFLKTQNRNGVPLYVYYGPRDPTTNKRPDAVVLPQLLTPGLVQDTITNQ